MNETLRAPARRCIPPNCPAVGEYGPKAPPRAPARRSIPPDCGWGTPRPRLVGAYRPTAPAGRRCIPPESSTPGPGSSVHSARLPPPAVGAYCPTAPPRPLPPHRVGAYRRLLPPARRCIAPAGPLVHTARLLPQARQCIPTAWSRRPCVPPYHRFVKAYRPTATAVIPLLLHGASVTSLSSASFSLTSFQQRCSGKAALLLTSKMMSPAGAALTGWRSYLSASWMMINIMFLFLLPKKSCSRCLEERLKKRRRLKMA